MTNHDKPEPEPAQFVDLLWSQRRNAWWRRNAWGYTYDLADAGRFTEADAIRYVVASAQSGQRDQVTVMVVAPDQELPADEAGHVLDLREDGWTIQHPLACRPDLFACRYNQLAEQCAELGSGPRGRFEVTIDGGRLVLGARIEQGVTS